MRYFFLLLFYPSSVCQRGRRAEVGRGGVLVRTISIIAVSCVWDKTYSEGTVSFPPLSRTKLPALSYQSIRWSAMFYAAAQNVLRPVALQGWRSLFSRGFSAGGTTWGQLGANYPSRFHNWQSNRPPVITETTGYAVFCTSYAEELPHGCTEWRRRWRHRLGPAGLARASASAHANAVVLPPHVGSQRLHYLPGSVR